MTAVTVGLWGLSRFVDEYFWLTHDNGTVAVEVVSLVLFALGGATVLALAARDRRRRTIPRSRPLQEPARSRSAT